MRNLLGAIAYATLLLLLALPVSAQEREHFSADDFEIFVDTKGVAEVQPGVYTTWVYAVAQGRSLPSSGILVAFDCKAHKVARLAHVVYGYNADSTGVEGPVVEDPGEWVDVSDDRIFDLVCDIGQARAGVRTT